MLTFSLLLPEHLTRTIGHAIRFLLRCTKKGAAIMSEVAEMQALWNEVYGRVINAGYPKDIATQLADRAVSTAQQLAKSVTQHHQ